MRFRGPAESGSEQGSEQRFYAKERIEWRNLVLTPSLIAVFAFWQALLHKCPILWYEHGLSGELGILVRAIEGFPEGHEVERPIRSLVDHEFWITVRRKAFATDRFCVQARRAHFPKQATSDGPPGPG